MKLFVFNFYCVKVKCYCDFFYFCCWNVSAFKVQFSLYSSRWLHECLLKFILAKKRWRNFLLYSTNQRWTLNPILAIQSSSSSACCLRKLQLFSTKLFQTHRHKAISFLGLGYVYSVCKNNLFCLHIGVDRMINSELREWEIESSAAVKRS